MEGHGNVVTYIGNIHVHSIVGTLQNCGNGKTGSFLLRHRVLTKCSDINGQGHRLGDVLDGQVTGHFQLVVAGLFDLGALEGRLREFFSVKEVRAQEVRVALCPERVEAADVDREFDGGIGRRVLVDQQRAFPFAETASVVE